MFLKLIEQNAGRITVLQLAKNDEISTQLAKQYLDEKAQELNASLKSMKREMFCIISLCQTGSDYSSSDHVK